MSQQIFLNSWAKGSAENANIGNGVFVGVETYSKKGIAQLTKDSFNVSGSVVTDLPLYYAQVEAGVAYVQGETGKIYFVHSVTTPYDTWIDITNGAATPTFGQGIVLFQGYLFAFYDGKIDYYNSSSWITNWQPNGMAPTLDSGNPLPIIIFPGDGFIYFGNGFRVGKFGYSPSGTFNPSGTGGTDYFFSDNWNPSVLGGLLPNYYIITSISFLIPDYIVLGTKSIYDQEVSDIILWNPTLITYELPLRLYSQANIGESGVLQLINRNNVIYAVVGGSHSIFRTNGQSFSLVSDLSLSSNIRQVGGAQAQVPVFMYPRLSAIDILGNKILTGVSTSENISEWPTGYGLFPCGVWSISMEGSSNAYDYETDSIQCEYTISTNTVVAVNKQFVIGFLKCVGANQVLIGWQDGTSYGVDLVSTDIFQSTLDNVMIESQMMEVGQPLTPETIQNFQLNTPRQLVEGQTVQFNYRTGFDQNYEPITGCTFTYLNNNDNGYKSTYNDIGATRFLQLQIQMESTVPIYSPEIRNIIISP